ncbi:MAG: signal peptidase II [Clostridia bacterium]|nr:signal peptidase II [Clostridia bacterium]
MKKFRYLFAVLFIVLDQLTKYIVRANLALGESVDVIPKICSFTYVRNYGAAFSSLVGQTFILKYLPIALIIICIVILEVYIKSHWTFLTSLLLIASGGVGNLIDRWYFGYVTDMIDFHFFPVFNVADICVTCGCGFLILYVLFFDKTEKTDGKQ